jgi:hypothetical protein
MRFPLLTLGQGDEMIKVNNSEEFDELLEGLARNIVDANIY